MFLLELIMVCLFSFDTLAEFYAPLTIFEVQRNEKVCK